MMTAHAPKTTFANGANPFAYVPEPRAKKTPKQRRVLENSPSVQKVFSVICATPGLTTGDLIIHTKNQAAAEYAGMLLDMGKVQAVFKKTKPGHFKAVCHFYPIGEMQ